MINQVITFRTRSNADLIGVLLEKKEKTFVVANPFFLRYDISSGEIAFNPFCAISDQTIFEFQLADTQFIVTVRKAIARHYTQLVEAINTPNQQLDTGHTAHPSVTLH